MKKIFSFCVAICFSTCAFSQLKIPSAQVGVEYGAGVQDGRSLNVRELGEVLSSDSVFTGRIEGKVIEVCLKKGCFMKLESVGDGEPVMVRFQDYDFFMPQDIMGKIVLLEGTAKVKETSVEQLKHFAEDAGKHSAEVAKITLPKTDIEVIAVGVKVVK